MSSMLLAGDVGGTKTRLALYELKGDQFSIKAEAKYSSQSAPDLESLIEQFLKEHPAKLTGGCIGIAGPVLDGRCVATNLPWVVDEKVIQKKLSLDYFSLINDLQATAYGVMVLPDESFAWLTQGEAVHQAPKAVVAAGTGLGEAVLVWHGEGYRAWPSEGGHCNFAPRNELEMELLRYMQSKVGHVSYERLISGPGKLKLYEFLRDTGKAKEPAWLKEALSKGDPSPLISQYTLSGESELCVKTTELFVSIYAAEASNSALKWLATGGVYLGGGIAPSILSKFKEPLFMESFLDKGHFKELLSRVPVAVILDDKAALYGAAYYAKTFSRTAN